MKKAWLILITICLIIMFSLYALLKSNQMSNKKIKQENYEYASYLNKQIYGTDLVTLINKVVEQNEKNNIKKDEKGYYIGNNVNSIKIEVKMLQTDLIYPMEEFYNKNITEFVKYFNLATFKCTKVEYHKESGKVSHLMFEQLE